MALYRDDLPQLSGDIFLTDGGIETTLIFHDGLDLPHMAAFDLLKHEDGRERLRRYFRKYADIARAHDLGFVLESVTWRASPDWAKRIGYSREELDEANRTSIALLTEIRDEYGNGSARMVISGCVGPRGDGYDPGDIMTPEEAEQYHAQQIGSFAGTDADMITAITMTNAEEAIGVTRAAKAAGMPVVISFTVETDGRLPTGQPLRDAIETVDAATDDGPAYYMINCAHPTHFADALASVEKWVERIRGLRANASSKSHEELDESEVLDVGNPVELGGQYQDLLDRLGHINVLGGCCGTDHRHVGAIAEACVRH